MKIKGFFPLILAIKTKDLTRVGVLSWLRVGEPSVTSLLTVDGRHLFCDREINKVALPSWVWKTRHIFQAFIPSKLWILIYILQMFLSFWISTSFSVSPCPCEWLFFSEPLSFSSFELCTFSFLSVVYGFLLMRILFWAFNFRSLSMAARFLRRRFILILFAAIRNLAWLFSAWTTVFHLNVNDWNSWVRKQHTIS